MSKPEQDMVSGGEALVTIVAVFVASFFSSGLSYLLVTWAIR